MERMTLSLSGMTCGHCVGRVQKTLDGLEGVKVEQVGINTATVAVDAPRMALASIERALGDAGYPVTASTPIT